MVQKILVLNVVVGGLEGPQAFPFIIFVLEPKESIAMACSGCRNRIMAQISSSFHVCGPPGAQYLAVTTSSRAFSGHVDGSDTSTGVGAWILVALVRPSIVTQGSETHWICVNRVECWKIGIVRCLATHRQSSRGESRGCQTLILEKCGCQSK